MVSLPRAAFSRREGSILKALEEDLRLVRDTEREIPALVAAVAQGDSASCSAKRDGIFELESKAAALHRDLSTQIAEGAFFGGIREDILNLLDKIDNIADTTKDAARLITMAEITDAKAVAVLRSEDMDRFLASLDQAVAALQNLIGGFRVDRKTVLERVHAVEEYEEAADTFKQNMLATLFQKAQGSIDPVTLILMRDFIFYADDVADNAEDASDVVLVLVAKGYG